MNEIIKNSEKQTKECVDTLDSKKLELKHAPKEKLTNLLAKEIDYYKKMDKLIDERKTYTLAEVVEYINKSLTLDDKLIIMKMTEVEYTQFIKRVAKNVKKHMEVVA